MLSKIEDFLMNRFAGKAIARISLVVAGYVAGPLASLMLAKTGISIKIDPLEVQAAVTSLLMAGFEYIKAKRAANPNSPTVQTDASKLPQP